METPGTWLQRLENGGELPSEYVEIARGLWELGYRDSDDDYDWVPSHVMRDRYYEKFTNHLRLSIQKFGIAVRLAYPPLGASDCRRVMREIKGKRYRGVSRLIGPGGVRTDDSKY